MSALPLFLRTNMLLVLPIDKIAQKLFWKGGTVGAESDWNTAENWSTNKVPTITDSVIIPNVSHITGHFPSITTSIPPIAHLEIQKGARLHIQKSGIFIINGQYSFDYGLNCKGLFLNQGQVIIRNTGFKNIRIKGGQLSNRGLILLDKEKTKGIVMSSNSRYIDLGKIKKDLFLAFLQD